jgi:outer membrane protein
MKLFSSGIGLFCALALLCMNVQAQSLKLSAAFEKALAADPGIQASKEALEAGRELSIQGQSLFKPQVSLAASVTEIGIHAESALPPAFASLAQPDTSGNVRKAEVQVVQPLINAGASASQTQLSRQSEGAEISWAVARQELMIRVTESYLGVIAARETLRVVNAESDSLEQQRERAQARFDVGLGKVTDVQEAQARGNWAQARQVSAQGALIQRVAQFEALTGASVINLPELAETVSLKAPDPELLVDWQTRAMTSNASILAKRIEVAITEANTRRYGLKSRPTLDLVAGYTAQNKVGDLSLLVSADQQRTASVGLRLNVPLFTGGSLNSREREALAKARQAELELAALQRDVRLQVQVSFQSVKTSIARIVSLQASERTARTALEATTQGRDIGTRTQLDVLDAQQRLFGTQQDLVQARIDLMLGRARLALATGELNESTLRLLDGELIP